jgi:hypothetical protein
MKKRLREMGALANDDVTEVAEDEREAVQKKKTKVQSDINPSKSSSVRVDRVGISTKKVGRDSNGCEIVENEALRFLDDECLRSSRASGSTAATITQQLAGLALTVVRGRSRDDETMSNALRRDKEVLSSGLLKSYMTSTENEQILAGIYSHTLSCR